jgi:FtsH-binding integral membrane protein
MTDPVSPVKDHRGHAGRAELWGGAIVLAVAAFFWFAWYTDRTGRGERAFLLFAIAFLVPLGLAVIATGLLARNQWSRRQWRVVGTLVLVVVALVTLWVWHV